MRFYANANWCTKSHATVPFPLNWPEQTIKVTSSEIPGNVAWAFRDLPEGKKQSAQARQLIMDIASLNPNDELSLVLHVEVEKYFIKVHLSWADKVIDVALHNGVVCPRWRLM